MASSSLLRLPTSSQIPLWLSRSTQSPLTKTTGTLSPHSSQLPEPCPVNTDVSFPTHFPPQFCVAQSLCDKVSRETRKALLVSPEGCLGCWGAARPHQRAAWDAGEQPSSACLAEDFLSSLSVPVPWKGILDNYQPGGKTSLL